MATLQEMTDALLDWWRKETDDENTVNVYECISELMYGSSTEIPLTIGTAKVEDTFGGEGQGDRYYVVLSLVTETGEKEYFQFNGFYSSWDGVYWEEAEDEKVVPQEKTIIEWVSSK